MPGRRGGGAEGAGEKGGGADANSDPRVRANAYAGVAIFGYLPPAPRGEKFEASGGASPAIIEVIDMRAR